jgi:hypothetical protein
MIANLLKMVGVIKVFTLAILRVKQISGLILS